MSTIPPPPADAFPQAEKPAPEQYGFFMGGRRWVYVYEILLPLHKDYIRCISNDHIHSALQAERTLPEGASRETLPYLVRDPLHYQWLQGSTRRDQVIHLRLVVAPVDEKNVVDVSHRPNHPLRDSTPTG